MSTIKTTFIFAAGLLLWLLGYMLGGLVLTLALWVLKLLARAF